MPGNAIFDPRVPRDQDAERDEQGNVDNKPRETSGPSNYPDQSCRGDQKDRQAGARDRDRLSHLPVAPGRVFGRPLLIRSRHARAFRAAMFNRQ